MSKNKDINTHDIRDRARAAGCYLNGIRHGDGNLPKNIEMAAFMSIFHPSIKGKRYARLLNKDVSKSRRN